MANNKKTSTTAKSKKNAETETEVKERGVIGKTYDVAKNAALFTADTVAPAVSFIAQSATYFIVGFLSVGLMTALGLTSIWAMAAVAVGIWLVSFLYSNYRAHGDASHVIQTSRAVKEAVNTTTTGLRDFVGMPNAA